MDQIALDEAVRQNADVIRRALASWPRTITAWYEGVGFVPLATIDLIRVSYRRIAAKRNHAKEESRATHSG